MHGPSDLYRDLFEPGWRDREAAHIKPFLDAIPLARAEPPPPSTAAMVAHLQRRESEVVLAALRKRVGYGCSLRALSGRLHSVVTPGGSTYHLDGEPFVWVGAPRIEHNDGTISVDREWRELP